MCFARIITQSKTLRNFIKRMDLPLSKPQMNHLLNMTDALLTCEGTKTLSALKRTVYQESDVYAIADFFRQSPWVVTEVEQRRTAALFERALAEEPEATVEMSFDDSLLVKPEASQGFEGFDWYKDHNTGQYVWALCFVTCHLRIGLYSFTATRRLYLRERTVKRLNRRRQKEDKLRYRSKYALVEAMLEELAPYLAGRRVCVMFDSWYAANDLINGCVQKGYRVICAIKGNRRFNGKKLNRIARGIWQKSWTRVRVRSGQGQRTYWTYKMKGRLKGVPSTCTVILSKRHRRDKRPEYFLCTDTRLSVQAVLQGYSRRWSVEVDYLYAKCWLGLSDFRMRTLAGIDRFFAVVFLALNYLQWQLSEQIKAGKKVKSLSELIVQHRQEHFRHVVHQIAKQAKQGKSTEEIAQFFCQEEAA